MSLTTLATVMSKLSASSVAAKGALGVAVAMAAVGTAGGVGLPMALSSSSVTVADTHETEVEEPVAEEVAEQAPVEDPVVEEVAEQAPAEDPVVEEVVEEPAVQAPVEEPTTTVVKKGAKAGTFGATVQEAKAAGATGRDVAELAKAKNAEKKAAKATGKPAGKGKPAPVVAEPVEEVVVEAPAEETGAE